jgi:hypothetical protein
MKLLLLLAVLGSALSPTAGSAGDLFPARPNGASDSVRSQVLRVGTASWYCLPGRSRCTSGYRYTGMYAAAGPALRIGHWRGRIVLVNGIRVKLVDWCSCPHRVMDLYASVFKRIAPLSRGLVRVRVTW